MKPRRFSLGQAVTPITEGPKVWFDWTVPGGMDPKQGEIYHVIAYKEQFGLWWVILAELPSDTCYDERGFDPVELTTEQITELLEETVPQTVEA